MSHITLEPAVESLPIYYVKSSLQWLFRQKLCAISRFSKPKILPKASVLYRTHDSICQDENVMRNFNFSARVQRGDNFHNMTGLFHWLFELKGELVTK